MTPSTPVFPYRSISYVVDSVLRAEASTSARPGVSRRHLYATTTCHASDRLVSAYLYLCRRGARKFLRTGLERSDLEQVAAIGLIKASRRYDERTTTPFEAYAWRIIVGELMHHVRDHERPVRLPRNLQALERRFNRTHETLLSRLHREPGDEELASELGVLVPTVRELRGSRNATIPTDLDGVELHAREDAWSLDLEDRVLIDRAFRDLTVVERRIIVGVYLLGLTQLELGRRLGLTPKRVSRAHHGALRRMQRTWAS